MYTYIYVCIYTQKHAHTMIHMHLRDINASLGMSTNARMALQTLQHTTTHCNTLQHTATHCTTLHHTATPGRYCNTPRHTATYYNTLQHTAAHCNTLHHTATPRNTLQHTATHRNTLHTLQHVYHAHVHAHSARGIGLQASVGAAVDEER